MSTLESLHQVLHQLSNTRSGDPWSDSLLDLVNELAYSIALQVGFSGDCSCLDSNCAISISVSDMYDYAGFIEWKEAKSIYDYLPRKDLESSQDEKAYQQKNESQLDFVRRTISSWQESDGTFSTLDEDRTTCMQLAGLSLGNCSVWFWIKSHPQKAGCFFEVHPNVWKTEDDAMRGLREIGFMDIDELSESDLPRLGFPSQN